MAAAAYIYIHIYAYIYIYRPPPYLSICNIHIVGCRSKDSSDILDIDTCYYRYHQVWDMMTDTADAPRNPDNPENIIPASHWETAVIEENVCVPRTFRDIHVRVCVGVGVEILTG